MVRLMYLVLIVALELMSSFRVEAQPQLPPLRIVDTSPPSTSFPTRLAVDAAGNMYVIDSDQTQVRVFNAAGTHLFDIGGPGTGNGQFTKATDVAVSNDGYLYVADTGIPDNNNIRVQKFNATTGAFVLKFGEAGRFPGQFFNQIMSLAVDSAGNVYVGSVFQLQKFDANGGLLKAFELGGILPWAMTIDRDDNIIFFEVDNGSFDKFNPTTHSFQILFFHEGCNLSNGAGCIDPDGDTGPLELGDGQLLGRPGALAVDLSGNIYVTDGPNFRIQKLSPDGTFQWKFGSQGTGAGQFGGPDLIGPVGLALNDTGHIYVTDPENQRIQIFAEAHSVLTIDNVTVTEGNTGTTPAVFTVTLTPASPNTVTVDYTTADQSARAGSDYTLTQGTLTFAPGDTTKTITVPVLGDNAMESDERFVVQLSNPTNATLATTQGVGEIVNDDSHFARCQNVTIPTTVNACTATSVSIDNGSSAPDGSPLTLTQNPAAPYPLGTTSVTLTAAAGSLSDTCTATVTVEDRQAPTISCPVDQTVTIQSGNSALVDFPSPLVFDNCPTRMTSCTPPSGSIFPRGNTRVICTTTDGAGLQQSCGFNVQVVVSDQAPVLRIDDVSLAEGNDPQKTTAFTFTVTLSKPSTGVVDVQYATADGTAEGIHDYRGIGGVVRFAPGETTKTVTIGVLGDRLPEADETFVVNLSNARGAIIGKGQGLGTILNDDGPRVFISDGTSSTRGREGNSGMTTYTFVVTLSQPSGTPWPVTVQYATADGTASAGSDYVATNGTLTFQRGETRKTVTVDVLGDTTPEADETFTVNLSNASYAVIDKGQGTGTVLNDDGTFVVISDVSRAEGDPGQRLAYTFTVTLSDASNTPVTVQYATADGTAIAGQDYLPVRGLVVFGPKETSKTITVYVAGDRVPEPNEQFFVNLSNATGTTIVDGEGIGTILNDDGPTLAITDVSKAEGNGGITTYTFTVTATRNGINFSLITVAYATADGTAAAGSDYTATSGTLTLVPGQTTQTITVDVLGDTAREPDETFAVNLSNASGATIFKSQGIGTIVNDD